MRYAIVISLNYDDYPHASVAELFQTIRENMLKVGFQQNERVFTIDDHAATACATARQAVAYALKKHGHEDVPHNYVKEFYGFEYSKAVNLLAPSVEGIEVQNLTDELLDALDTTDTK